MASKAGKKPLPPRPAPPEGVRPFWERFVRPLSAACMLVVGAMALYLGYPAVVSLAFFLAAAGIWEFSQMFRWQRRRVSEIIPTALLALAYVGVGVLSLLYVYKAGGAPYLVYAFVIAAASDTGGFAVGYLLGGPKLAPKISPKKTWSGFYGGLVIATALGGMYGILVLDMSRPQIWAPLSLGLAALATFGDLFESKLKRKAGVKDSSNLIPGHGGVLDRFDSVFFVLPALAIFLAK